MPPRPPSEASSTLSVSNWRTSRARSAPIDSRTAISCRRAVARASSRLATLAQAMSSTSPTMAISTLPASTSCCWNCGGNVPSVIGRTASERPRNSVGNASSSPWPMAADVGLGLLDADARLQPRDRLVDQARAASCRTRAPDPVSTSRYMDIGTHSSGPPSVDVPRKPSPVTPITVNGRPLQRDRLADEVLASRRSAAATGRTSARPPGEAPGWCPRRARTCGRRPSAAPSTSK